MVNCKHLLLNAVLLLGTNTCFSQVTWGLNNSRTDNRNDAGLQGNQGAMSGFYQTEFPVNFPVGANWWWHLLDVRHTSPGNNYAMQFSGSFFDQNLFFRKTNDNSSAPWSRVLLEDANGAASTGRLLTRSIAFVDNDKFTYNNGSNNYLINNYGLEWNSDSWVQGAPTAWLSGNGGIKLFTGSQCRLAITANGSIGIGTTTPGTNRLAVEGTIAARKVRVTQLNPWPDYVFSRRYNLRNLDAVESYISRHKHLPDVPAAAQIAKDGLDIGENQAVLLRKVEELTLYVIQLNKAVRQLQAENQQHKRTIARLANRK